MVSTGFPSSASAQGKLYRIIDPARWLPNVLIKMNADRTTHQ